METIRYKTEFVDDLPVIRQKGVAYVVGGRQFPFRVVMTCPNPICHHEYHLPIDKGALWQMQAHEDDTITLTPSVHNTGNWPPCQAHFFLRRGEIVWAADDQPIDYTAVDGKK